LFEPAGYIPLESMACGTPVLTYAWQGPGETVKNNKTGWVVSTREEFSEMALRIWNEGYDPNIRKDCREYVIENFGVKKASEKLSKIIKKHC
jgi:glycosyltransferase involved in cell wall biosynthesis